MLRAKVSQLVNQRLSTLKRKAQRHIDKSLKLFTLLSTRLAYVRSFVPVEGEKAQIIIKRYGFEP